MYQSDEMLSVEEEQTLTIRYQAGDSAAAEKLLAAYHPAIRAAARKFETLLGEDAMQEATLAFLRIAKDHDFTQAERLSWRVKNELGWALKDAATLASSPWSIPAKTQKRFIGIVHRANNDFAVGLEIAQEMGMSQDTFTHIWGILRNTDSLHSLNDDAPVFCKEDFLDIETVELVNLAFAALDSVEESSIIEDYYGFTSYDPVSDAEIAHRRGMNRTKVNRVRNDALQKMREGVGIL